MTACISLAELLGKALKRKDLLLRRDDAAFRLLSVAAKLFCLIEVRLIGIRTTSLLLLLKVPKVIKRHVAPETGGCWVPEWATRTAFMGMVQHNLTTCCLAWACKGIDNKTACCAPLLFHFWSGNGDLAFSHCRSSESPVATSSLPWLVSFASPYYRPGLVTSTSAVAVMYQRSVDSKHVAPSRVKAATSRAVVSALSFHVCFVESK